MGVVVLNAALRCWGGERLLRRRGRRTAQPPQAQNTKKRNPQHFVTRRDRRGLRHPRFFSHALTVCPCDARRVPRRGAREDEVASVAARGGGVTRRPGMRGGQRSSSMIMLVVWLLRSVCSVSIIFDLQMSSDPVIVRRSSDDICSRALHHHILFFSSYYQYLKTRSAYDNPSS